MSEKSKRKGPTPAHEILARFLARKQKRNPAYSMRAFARDVGLSPSYASRMLKGEKPISAERLERLAEVLEIDQIGREQLEKSLIHGTLEKKARGNLRVSRTLDQLAKSGGSSLADAWDYQELDFSQYKILESWYHLAVLNLATCADFVLDPKWIAARLAITPEQAQESLALLSRLGVLIEKDGKIQMFHNKLRFPTKSSDPRIRHHHRQMIQKSVQHMMTRTGQTDFDRRLITSMTFACEPSKIDEAKSKIEAAMFEVVQELSAGDCTEIYQYNLQVFPLTLRREKK